MPLWACMRVMVNGFVSVARRLGLTEGKPKSCGPGEDLKRELATVYQTLGAYPHRKLNKLTTGKPKKETPKRLKLLDPNQPDYTLTIGEDLVKQYGRPKGPSGKEMLTKQEIKELADA